MQQENRRNRSTFRQHLRNQRKTTLICLSYYWKNLLSILWPIICLQIFIFGTDIKIRCLYVEMVIYGYWIFDCLPEAITALIPVFALPILQIQPSYITCKLYFTYCFFMVGALFLAVVMEYSGIHERLILYLSLKFGATPRVSHIALTFVACSVSVWIADAYAIQMIVPVITKIFYEIDMPPNNKLRLSQIDFTQEGDKSRPINLSLAFYCGLIYSSIFGGINFVSGTITNLVFRAVFQCRFPSCSIDQNPWFFYTIIVCVVTYIGSMIWLQIIYLGLWNRDAKTKFEYELLASVFKDQKIIENLYVKLGKISWHEISVATSFTIYLTSWYIDRALYFINMKQYLSLFISDATPFIIITFILNLLPAQNTFLYSFSSNPDKRPKNSSPSLMPWEILRQRVPWGRVLVVGAGISMGNAQLTSGLAKEAAEIFIFMKEYHYWVTLFIVTLFGLVMTEICSNVITCGVFIPTIIELSILLHIHPIYLGLPFTIACSMGFLFPIASPNVKKVTNVVDLPLRDLMIAGIFPKIFTSLVLYVTFDSYGKYIFNEMTEPVNFNDTNVTCFCKPCLYKNSSTLNYYW